VKILIKYFLDAHRIQKHGEWYDAFPRMFYAFKQPQISLGRKGAQNLEFDSKLVDLGFAVKLPKYFEANIVPRSSTYLKQGLIQANHFAVIDYKYCGEEDIWKFSAIALRETTIGELDEHGKTKAICQFRIQPCMDAPWYVKLKWLFTSTIRFVEVDELLGPSRGGFGQTDSSNKQKQL